METPETREDEPEVPHDNDLDLEGPNESAPGHNPEEGDGRSEDSDS